MIKRNYKFVPNVPRYKVQQTLDEYALAGWRLVSTSLGWSELVVDLVFEKENQ